MGEKGKDDGIIGVGVGNFVIGFGGRARARGAGNRILYEIAMRSGRTR